MGLLNDFLELSGHYNVSREIAKDFVEQLAYKAGNTEKGTARIIKDINFDKLKEISQNILIDASADKGNSKRVELIEALTYLPDMVQFLNTKAGKHFMKLYRTVSNLGREVTVEWISQTPELKEIKPELKPQSPVGPFGAFENPAQGPGKGSAQGPGPGFIIFGNSEIADQFRKMMEQDLEDEDIL